MAGNDIKKLTVANLKALSRDLNIKLKGRRKQEYIDCILSSGVADDELAKAIGRYLSSGGSGSSRARGSSRRRSSVSKRRSSGRGRKKSVSVSKSKAGGGSVATGKKAGEVNIVSGADGGAGVVIKDKPSGINDVDIKKKVSEVSAVAGDDSGVETKDGDIDVASGVGGGDGAVLIKDGGSVVEVADSGGSESNVSPVEGAAKGRDESSKVEPSVVVAGVEAGIDVQSISSRLLNIENQIDFLLYKNIELEAKINHLTSLIVESKSRGGISDLPEVSAPVIGGGDVRSTIVEGRNIDFQESEINEIKKRVLTDLDAPVDPDAVLDEIQSDLDLDLDIGSESLPASDGDMDSAGAVVVDDGGQGLSPDGMESQPVDSGEQIIMNDSRKVELEDVDGGIKDADIGTDGSDSSKVDEEPVAGTGAEPVAGTADDDYNKDLLLKLEDENEPDVDEILRYNIEDQPVEKAEQKVVPRSLRMICQECKQEYTIDDPDFSQRYKCPRCDLELLYLLRCPMCNAPRGIKQADFDQVLSDGTRCLQCDARIVVT
ncbi:MAG: hypothetical protein ACTSWN_02030 [Promethearchaeota archaeon]